MRSWWWWWRNELSCWWLTFVELRALKFSFPFHFPNLRIITTIRYKNHHHISHWISCPEYPLNCDYVSIVGPWIATQSVYKFTPRGGLHSLLRSLFCTDSLSNNNHNLVLWSERNNFSTILFFSSVVAPGRPTPSLKNYQRDGRKLQELLGGLPQL